MANTIQRADAPRFRAYRVPRLDGARTTFDCATDCQIPLVDGVTVICRDGADRQRIVDTATQLGLRAAPARVGDRGALLIQDRQPARAAHTCSLASARCVLGVCGEPEPVVDIQCSLDLPLPAAPLMRVEAKDLESARGLLVRPGVVLFAPARAS